MYKALCVAVLLLPTFAVTQGSKARAASAGTFSSPQIVAKAKLPHQTAAIPTTTILTPAQDGLYRMSVYATLTTTAQNATSNWNYNLFWTDDAGPQSVQTLLYGFDYFTGPFWQLYDNGTSVMIGGPATVFEAKAGQPISYGVSQNGSPDGSAYSLYYVLERLE
jgi:hypothetical protein